MRGIGVASSQLIRAAALSAPLVPLEGCVAAAIVTTLDPKCFPGPSHIAFWRMGSQVASCAARMDAEDVIYHDGAFHFVFRQGDLLMCTPNEATVEQLQVGMDFRMFLGSRLAVLRAGARYLVECRGELLMVLRIQPHHKVTSEIRVSRMTQEQAPDADGTYAYYSTDAGHARYSWTELPTLDCRMLFVWRGCSRSFEVAHFPGSQEGVYFLDDGSFHAAPLICYGDGPRQYGCCNNGVWYGPPDDVHHWFPLQPIDLLVPCLVSPLRALTT
ncbi:hypothetical protein BAE44_0000417, partial [Dichanthelium oligosanthes]